MKKIAIILTMLVPLLFSFGCGKAPEKNYAMATSAGIALQREALYTSEDSTQQFGRMRDEKGVGSSDSAAVPELERKLVKSANLSIRVDNLEKADASVSTMLEQYKGYAASTNISENSRYYSLRIPAPQYDTFLTEVNGMGRLINRYENTEDVTLRYYDLEGRLETRRELLRTYQSYLRRANNMEEILSVEARIADLQHDIENTGTQLRHLSNKVDYASIDLQLLGPVAVTKNKSETLGERIKQLFGGFGGFLSTAAVILLGIVVYGIPSLAIAILLFWLLFGRIGLLKKLWRLVMVKKQG